MRSSVHQEIKDANGEFGVPEAVRGQKNQGRKGFAAFAPSFDCAAKFLRLPGSIWVESKP